ncbi:MAG TPA: LysM peptidoglycan-binding domain-containing protein [Myxococcaceae bacterium]|nr:LysM peptidoglycan-binding domain-containing protein [Myxococcaceae bacterium]
MRSRILSSLLVASVLAPSALWAQEEGELEDSEVEGAEVIDGEPGQPGSIAIPPGQGGRESAPGEVHSVVEGDTLWDLSQRYLGSPWYWPKVWSYNPEIANPHWIYPGNLVRLFPAGEEVPSRVEAGIGPAPLELVAEEGEFSPATELDVLSGEDLVQVSGKLTYEPKAARTVMTQGFVTTRELDEAGRIDSSFSEAQMLTSLDTVYVRFKRQADARLGDRYVIFHTVKDVTHPVTGRKVGFLTEFVGTLRVTSLSERYVTAQIVDAWDVIVRGDLVGPFGERLVEQVVPRRNEKEVQGYVVTAMVPYLSLVGEHHFLVVDKGSSDGVQVGNVFTVIRQNDVGGDIFNPAKVEKGERLLPIENIATCLVTEVKDRTSNCVLTQSVVEVVPGDRMVMKVSQGPTAQR